MMKNRSQWGRNAVPMLGLCGLAGVLFWLPPGSAAQTPSPSVSDKTTPEKRSDDKGLRDRGTEEKGTGDKGKTDTEMPPKKQERQPPPGNPLLLTDPTIPLPTNNTGVSKPEFNDYRKAQNAPPAITKPLALFGYDFFRPAREIIDAHRDYIKRIQRERADEALPRKSTKTNANSDSTDDTGTNSRRRTNTTDTGTDNGSDNPPRKTTKKTTRRTSQSDPGSDNSGNPDNTDNSDTSDNSSSQTNRSRSSNSESDPGPVDARQDVADPLTQLYRNVTATVPANYQVAPGDTLMISYWSPTLERTTVTKTVDGQGTIALTGIAPIVVLGKTVASTELSLKEALSRFYRNVQVSVTLNRLRTIQVTVSGEAYQPGTYAVPAVASAFNMLTFAGGPTESGSLRNIEIRRGGRLVGSLDMYKFELGSGQATDYSLQSGDMIVIPPRLSRIAVRGEVLHPAVFELIEGETLSDALHYAGGIKASGVNHSVRINTLDPGNARIIQDVDVKDAAAVKALRLFDGDEVEVFSVRPVLTNRVTVEGAVDQPNDYPLTPNMRVSDLLNRARGPINEAYLTHAELRRWNPDTTTTLQVIDIEKALAHDPQHDLLLQKWDRLKVYTRDEVAYLGRRMVTVKGAVQKEGIYPVSRNMHVSDLLRSAGGPTPEANLEKAFLIHQREDGPSGKEDVNLNAVLRGDAGKDPEIQDNDTLIVYNFRQAQFTPDHIVQVVGEVVTAGVYPRTQGMKLSELIGFAGGLTPSAGHKVSVAHARRQLDGPNANLNVAVFSLTDKNTLPSDADIVLEDGDVVSIPGVGGYLPAVQKVKVSGAVNTPGYIFLKSKNVRLSDVIKEAGGLRPEAFPQGAQFYRNPELLATTGQKQLESSIGMLNDLLNDSAYLRERGKSRLDIIRATGQAQQSASGDLLGGLTGGAAAAAAIPNAAAGAAGNQLASQELVTKARPSGTDSQVPDGNIAVDLPLALRHPNTPDDIVLVDGDTISIPETPTTVKVAGAVFHPRGVQFKPNETLLQYIAEAGGYAPDAALDRIEIIRVGGGLAPAKKAGPIQPGDVILVPTKVLAASISSHSNGISDFFKSLTSSAIIFKLATGLFGR